MTTAASSSEPQGLPPTEQENHVSAVLERIFKGSPFMHGASGHPQFLNDVTVDIRTGYVHYGAEKRGEGESIRITVTDPHVATAPKDTAEFLLNRLKELPVNLESYSELEPKREHLGKVKTELLDLAAQSQKTDSPISAEIIEKSPVLNADVREYGIDKHGLQLKKDDSGIEGYINVPKGGEVSASQIADALRARMAIFKSSLAKRVEKYTVGTDAQKKAAAAQVAAMEITVAEEERDYKNTVTVTLRSPQQAQIARQPGGLQKDHKAFRDSNILSAIPDSDQNPQLQKALMRSVSETLHEPRELAAILGWKDIQAYLQKGLSKLKQSRPELAARIDGVLKEEAFQRNDWNEAPDKQPEGKGEISIATDPEKRGVMYLTLNLPMSASASKILADIAALDPSLSKPHQTHSSSLFAQVDNVQLVGANSPQAYAQAQQLLTQFGNVQSAVPASTPTEQAIKPFAERVVALVEEAHQAILDATKIAASNTVPSAQVQVQQFQPSRTQNLPSLSA